MLTGKAKFGIFGDGKELAQLCLAKQFMDGDYQSHLIPFICINKLITEYAQINLH